jgi:glycogenin glucosyltransferase
VLKNVDELFEREEFSAVTDIGWPDCFNSGVFVFKPSLETYASLLKFAVTDGSFDGGDQGLLNAFFNTWSTGDSSRRLPFIYNMTTNASYSYAPAYKQFKETIKIVHFIGAQKPWYYSYNLDTQTVVGNVTVYETEHLNCWWHTFVDNVLAGLNNETRFRLSTQLIQKEDKPTFTQQQMSQYGQASHDAPQSSHQQASGGGIVIGSDQHKNLWEHGQIEYSGRDSFDNIQAHLDSQLNKK